VSIVDTLKLKKFSQYARRSLIEQVSNKLDFVLALDSQAKREQPQAVERLEDVISKQSKEQIIEKIAYIWFNRFCALRFMDVNGYTSVGIVSPVLGQTQPEILADAKMGHIDEVMVPDEVRKRITSLLDDTTPARYPQSEAYRLLIVAACNYYYSSMPFLFERISDYTELLMPDDLLSSNSILAYTREAMIPKVCKDVEVIGWLYQFYISEKKDEVFSGFSKNKKITPENIPAATQLFTPHWIVRYLVENSLGRLWMLNHPNSKLINQMDYYIKPKEKETDFLQLQMPEELKISDPACGSGHMLTYAFDLLYSIYEEEGYQPSEIPTKILTHNLYGIEIDERAGELAAFALTMKARNKQKRFFNKKIQPNICVLENIDLTIKEEEQTLFTTNNTDLKWQQILNTLSKNINREYLIHDLNLFQEADNFGSLLKPKLNQKAIKATIQKAEQLINETSSDIVITPMLRKAIKALKQAEYLTKRYQIVIANPPYMGSKGMNATLSAWVKKNYPNSKSDLFAIFIERNLELAIKQGNIAMITMQSWMFLSSYEKLRTSILDNQTILSMTHLGTRAFDSIGGEVVSTTAFVIKKTPRTDFKGDFLRLVEGVSEAEKKVAFKKNLNNGNLRFGVRTRVFREIPGSPIAYWLPDIVFNTFTYSRKAKEIASSRAGMTSGDNERFTRQWFEVSQIKINYNAEDWEDAILSGFTWFPYNKGGAYRKWFGNVTLTIRYDSIYRKILKTTGNKCASEDCYFKEGITWTDLTSSRLGARYLPGGAIFDIAGHCAFPLEKNGHLLALAMMNTSFISDISKVINATLHFQPGDFRKLPFPRRINNEQVLQIVHNSIELSKSDWNAYETSWNFSSTPLLQLCYPHLLLKDTYYKLRSNWVEMTSEMQRLEIENNRIFINAYGLQNEFKSTVPLSEVTLTCNPHYRYKGDKTEAELESLLLADTMKEFISYAVGCMFGRYSLDKPGLILANQGETIEDYLAQIPSPTFSADDDNVIPILDDAWFSDDVTERFFKFLHVTFGDEHYEENLQFIENAIGKSIRKYFLKDFYKDHVRRYKKRPIYWMFSSPKGSFNVLIYMHRYRSDTVSLILNGYLREFRAKLNAKLAHLEKVSIGSDSSKSEKAKAIKEIEKLKKVITEVEDYERDILYPLATKQKRIDLDDGVKFNYNEFSKALKKITGLTGK